MMKINSNKRIIVLCDLGVGGERGRVFAPRSNAPAVTATEYKDPMKDINQDLSYSGGQLSDNLCGKLERCAESCKEDNENNVNPSNIYILGSIGNTPRQNRDNMRVFSKKSVCPCLKSHISKESIMVVREWETGK
jgi:hypothetical protein